MEPYKPLGCGGYGRSMNQRNMNQRGMYQRGMYNNQMSGNRQDGNNYNNSGCGCSEPVPAGKERGYSESRRMSDNKDCDCRDNNTHMRHMPLAMGYVPMQEWNTLYDPEAALCQGTAFPELNLIFCGSRGKM